MSGQETEILTKLLNFYKRKYSGKQLDEKFYDAVMDLVSTGDIRKSTYFTFCADNDMEPHVNKTKFTNDLFEKIKTVPPKSSSSSSGYDSWGSSGCGSSSSSSSSCGGGGYTRSSC